MSKWFQSYDPVLTSVVPSEAEREVKPWKEQLHGRIREVKSMIRCIKYCQVVSCWIAKHGCETLIHIWVYLNFTISTNVDLTLRGENQREQPSRTADSQSGLKKSGRWQVKWLLLYPKLSLMVKKAKQSNHVMEAWFKSSFQIRRKIERRKSKDAQMISASIHKRQEKKGKRNLLQGSS